MLGRVIARTIASQISCNHLTKRNSLATDRTLTCPISIAQRLDRGVEALTSGVVLRTHLGE